jgi:hypothetical protein
MATTVETLHFLGQLVSNSRENIAKSAYRNVAEAFVARWKLSVDDVTKMALHKGQSPRYYHDPTRPTAPVVLEALDQCMKFGLEHEGCHILKQNLPLLPPSLDKFWLRWLELHTFYLSLLALLKRHNSVPLNNLSSKWLINAIESAATHLARTRPQEPTGWPAPRKRRIKCVGKHCRALERFLNDHTQATHRFSEIASIRKHLEDALGRTPDLRMETQKNGSPYTLVVNKLGLDYTQKKAIWEQETVKMRKEVGALVSPFTTNIFGGVITQLVGLEKRPVTAEVAGRAGEGSAEDNTGAATGRTRRSLQPATASVQNVVAVPALAGTKRKADVIDLTEDDPVSA